MEWKEVRLGDSSVIFIDGDRGKNYPKGNEFSPSGYCLFLNAGNVTKDGFVFQDNAFISREKDETLRKGKLQYGDLVLTTRGTVGNVAYYHQDVKYTNIRINSGMVIIRHEKDFDTEFLYHYLRSALFQNQIKQFQSGSAQPQLPISTLNKMMVIQPSISDQRRIASILSSLDRKIELNNKINAQLEEMAQAIFKSWFVDFEPFKVGADGSAPTYGSGKFVESELGMIPEGWRVGTLSEVADINPKRPLKKGEEATYLDMKNMPTSGSFPNQWEKKIMNGGMKFQNGDTLMARITPCLENGKVAYVNFLDNNEVGFGSTEYIVMTSKSGVFPEIFYTLCRYPDFVAYATRNMNGSSGRQRVSGEVIGNYKVVIPPASVIEKLQPLFASIMEQIKDHGFESANLSHLRDTLLPKLMSGEIEI